MPSPVVIVDSSIYLYIDYRQLNCVTPANAYPMPSMIDQLGFAEFRSCQLNLGRTPLAYQSHSEIEEMPGRYEEMYIPWSHCGKGQV